MTNWTPATTNPPASGQYQIRIHIAAGRYTPISMRMWTGETWRSKNGLMGTGFGSLGDLSQHQWRPIADM